jgi:MYXO-CTERM domain-containing protein
MGLPQYTESGVFRQTGVWTGTTNSGLSGGTQHALGSALLGAYVGTSELVYDQPWVDFEQESIAPPDANALFAVSGILTVPAPEPSSIVLACLGVAALAVPALRRRRR